jgi:hypothetical protein
MGHLPVYHPSLRQLTVFKTWPNYMAQLAAQEIKGIEKKRLSFNVTRLPR